MANKTTYLTTPLYYVNAAPHIGHSYTEVAVDCLARFRRLKGEDVFFLTGTDEHGQKIAQAAKQAGRDPQAFVDDMVGTFKNLWQLLRVEPTYFIRTTDADHKARVREILARLHNDGKLGEGEYQGWYCTPDETFWTVEEVGGADVKDPKCPTCGRLMDSVKEKGWYLPLEKDRAWLRGFLEAHRGFVQPGTRFNEIYSLLEAPLPEHLWITRPRRRVSWGIPVPFSDDHVTYVWFDALLNYITAIGYPDDLAKFGRYWPVDIHVIGKDILRHHALYWPIILRALGFSDEQMPRMIFAHGWWKVGEQKMSKSLGNIVNPMVVVEQLLAGQPHAADVYRYFLLREVPFGQDGAFSEEALFTRLGADLGNDLGNLVNRTLSMIERYGGGAIPQPGPVGCAVDDEPLQRAAVQLAGRVEAAMARMEFSIALEAIMQVVSQANRYIEAVAPWKLAKDEGRRARLQTVLYSLADVARIVAITLSPFMPSVSDAIWGQLGCTGPRRLRDAAQWGLIDAGRRVGARAVLFPRREQ